MAVKLILRLILELQEKEFQTANSLQRWKPLPRQQARSGRGQGGAAQALIRFASAQA
jgi:hypothetical protein